MVHLISSRTHIHKSFVLDDSVFLLDPLHPEAHDSLLPWGQGSEPNVATIGEVVHEDAVHRVQGHIRIKVDAIHLAHLFEIIDFETWVVIRIATSVT